MIKLLVTTHLLAFAIGAVVGKRISNAVDIYAENLSLRIIKFGVGAGIVSLVMVGIGSKLKSSRNNRNLTSSSFEL